MNRDPARTGTRDGNLVDEAGEESFPASDPPSANPLHAGQPNRRTDQSARDDSGVLPSGYESQVLFGFHDRDEHYAYELCFVYAPPARTDRRGSIATLDKDRSYWQRRPLGLSERDDHPLQLSFAEARRRWGRRLKFARFASVGEMRESLPSAFEAGGR